MEYNIDLQIDQALEDVQNIIKESIRSSGDSNLAITYDMINPYRAKREQVVRDFIKKYYDPQKDYWLTNYVILNFTYPKSYELLEEDESLTLAMALYMIDHIEDISEVRKLSAGCPIDDVMFPFFIPLGYQHEDVKSILYIIQHRNDDLGENHRILLNPYSFQKSVPEVPSRARFHALMKLVGHRTEARAYYEKKRKEWFETFVRALDAYTEVEKSYHEQIADPFYQNGYEPLPSYEFFTDFLEPNLSYKSREERKKQSLAVHDAYIHLPRLFNASAQTTDFVARLNDEYQWETDHTPPAMVMREYQVEDPYFLAYGLLVLLDERDDSLFDYGVNVGMLNRAATEFAWHYDYEGDDLDIVNAHDYFHKDYEYEKRKYPVNALLYDTSGFVLPSQVEVVKPRIELDAKDQGFVDGFMTAVDSFSHVYEEVDDGNRLVEELVDTQQINKKLRQEVEKLKRESHFVTSKTNQYKDKYEKIKHEYDQLNDEVARLREIIFHRDEEDLPEEKVDISFPYQVKEKVLVYGGHKSWYKNMKQLFNGPIEFMLSGGRPPHDYLRSFDVIWLQTDSIGHDDYYYLIDIVRRYDLNFHYFTMRGVKACAKELVEYEER